MITQPSVLDGKSWLRRLESRETASLYFGLEHVRRDPSLLAKAHAGTKWHKRGAESVERHRQITDLQDHSMTNIASLTPKIPRGTSSAGKPVGRR
jgi:hypothetical protein